MKSIAGRAVCETLEELVDPRSSALLLVDLQNDFVAAGGLVNRRGEGRDAALRGVVANTADVIRRAREVGAPLVYLRYIRTADHRFESPASLRWMVLKRGYATDRVSAVEGTWGAEIVDALAPRPVDTVIDKRRPSGFFGTGLDQALRTRGIRTVILAGVSTHGCVEATARDAELHDYYVVLLEDCVGAYSEALHHAAMTVMASRYEVAGSGAVTEAWSRAPAAQPARIR
jgi:nicotinamidase-related amidase